MSAQVSTTTLEEARERLAQLIGFYRDDDDADVVEVTPDVADAS